MTNTPFTVSRVIPWQQADKQDGRDPYLARGTFVLGELAKTH